MDISMLIKFAALAIYIVLLIGLGAMIALKGKYVCKRRACIRKANFMLANLNSSVDPCSDFYRYTCDNFKFIRTNIWDGTADVQTYIEKHIDNTLHSLFNTPIHVTDDRVLKIIKKMYQPCIDRELLNRQKTKPLRNAIYTSGVFPVIDEKGWNENEFSIGMMDEMSRRSGFTGGHIFRTYIAKDMKRLKRYIIHITPPNNPTNPGHEIVTRKYDKSLYDDYLSFIVRLVFFLIGNENYEKDVDLKEKYSAELDKTIHFKRTLYQYLKDFKRRKNPADLYKRMSIKDLQRVFPILNWAEFFKYMLPTSTKPPKEVVVMGFSYFEDISKLILKSEKRMIANFLMLENLMETFLFMPAVYLSIYNKFNAKYNSNVNRTLFCENVVKQKLKGAISSLLLQQYNTTLGSQDFLNDLTQKVKMDIKNSISQRNSWMDTDTRKEAIAKLNGLRLQLSLSDDQLFELTDYDARAKYYEDLCLGTRKTHVLPAYFCLNRFYFKKNCELLSRNPTVFDEDIDVITSNMRYIQNMNEIIIPYGVLKEPSYDGLWPMYLNYGGVGSSAVHVIVQGMDIKGKDNDEFGFRNTWWTNRTVASYDKRVECFGEKYKMYTKERLNLTIDAKSGKTRKLLAKAISSISGVHLAYRAYQEYLKSRTLSEQTMPGLENFTSTQLFFLSYVNARCGFYTTRKHIRIVRISREIPRDFLVEASLDTMNEFKTAFNCAKGDYMVSTKKCKLLF